MDSADNNAQVFLNSDLSHCLMVTNHGLHQWDVIPGLPDTGGQNIYVNQFSDALAKTGFRVTIANRGGFAHPLSGKMRSGLHYKDGRQRILYLEDDVPHFVRKEDMLEHIPYLVDNLESHLQQENIGVDMIVSHYWDAALLAQRLIQKSRLKIPHIWIPHSLAAIKKRNVSQESWHDLRIEERMSIEQELLSQIRLIGTTSPLISRSLVEDYHYSQSTIDMPPCIDTERFYPSVVQRDHPLWTFLSGYSNLTADDIYSRRIISEISRSDSTKRKDILIKAFAAAHSRHADALLILTAAGNETMKMQLRDLITGLGLANSVILLGSVSQWLPAIYNASYTYCTPSVMEGFGMSAQEAAACGKPVIASSLVPFVSNYLLGAKTETMCDNNVIRGSGGMTFKPDDVTALSCAMNILLDQPQLTHQMGMSAYRSTIPYFTWEKRILYFLSKIKLITS